MRRVIFAMALTFSSGVFAQHTQPSLGSAYSSMQGRDIKAFSDEQLADLREGRGMGASLPAELNGVPGPLHVLQLAGQLKVSPEQQAALERVMSEMKASAQRLGTQLIAAEAELDRSFRLGSADELSITEATSRIAALQGQLRAVHLVAHVKARQLLSAEQVAAYNVARGYGQEPSSHSRHH
ncbi:Spy/CpxP family protein refolding chaperone [Aquabacterium sp.]|uniref:Spy/CpxP family protein refolding chaperone n=1 Tax=Aquabacterium sp. TaxID=1872578 RepID=UPI002CF1C7A1|nr:Spy/CpxP family protein refolding chaperone [Aquabacterium sp.]HSW08010.1 Spy/CpxP family protein refolding chaperone [Aquabacterium sp.]